MNGSDLRGDAAAVTALSPAQRRTLAAITMAVVLVTVGLVLYQRVAPAMQLKADGYSKAGTVQGHDVWAKVRANEVSVHVLGDNGDDLCEASGPISPPSLPLCADAFEDDGSALVAVAPQSGPATIVTTAGSEVPAFLVREPDWRFALAVRVAPDDSLLGASLK